MLALGAIEVRYDAGIMMIIARCNIQIGGTHTTNIDSPLLDIDYFVAFRLWISNLKCTIYKYIYLFQST